MTSNKQRSSGALDVAVMGGAAAALAAAAGLIGLVRGGNRSQAALAPDLEFLLARARTIHSEQGRDGKASSVPLSALVAAMEESGAAGGGAGPRAAPQPAAAGGDTLTKKELEDTMRSMLAPPGAGGFGGPDGESALDRFTQDLTQSARMGKLDPVICRDDEIRRLIHILSRRTKNNPVLIGESGVGKTAVVEGLAQRIIGGDVPMSLLGVKVLELDLGALTAGCMMPGEFEERLKAVLNEIEALRGRAVLFIDDIHNLVPVGGVQGATMMDGGSLLKPALSRGTLRCIGASSPDKFKKTIEKDPALERRFQQVFVDQPSVAATISILRGLRARYEGYHGVGISEAALMAAANLSARYISGRYLPDKAIDLMDEATAQVKMEQTLKPEALDAVERKIRQLEMEEASLKPKAAAEGAAAHCLAEIQAQLQVLRATRQELSVAAAAAQDDTPVAEPGAENHMAEMMRLSAEIENTNDEADSADADGDVEEASELRTRVSHLEEQLSAVQRRAMEAAATKANLAMSGMVWRGNRPAAEVAEADIAKVVSRWTGIPLTKLVASEREKLLHLTDELHQRIIGQEEAVDAVAEAIQRSRADLVDPNGPIASFMFLGPTGVGKTELAKALAAYMFNSEDAMVRMDMSEYMEKHAVSRLIGAPPGYVGYDEGGLLTDAVKRRPYSVVLFDEIEKAHVDVFNVLLQILDDGRVTDTQGHTISFKNTLIIMTSNLGSAEIFAESAEDSDRAGVRARVMEHVRGHFRPEFINRIDEFITFTPLRRDQITQIVRLRAQRLIDRMAEKRMRLDLRETAVEHLAKVGYDPVYGARPVKRALQRELQTLLAQALLRNEFQEDDTVVVEACSSGKGLVLSHGPRLKPVAANGNGTADGAAAAANGRDSALEQAVHKELRAELDKEAAAQLEAQGRDADGTPRGPPVVVGAPETEVVDGVVREVEDELARERVRAQVAKEDAEEGQAGADASGANGTNGKVVVSQNGHAASTKP